MWRSFIAAIAAAVVVVLPARLDAADLDYDKEFQLFAKFAAKATEQGKHPKSTGAACLPSGTNAGDAGFYGWHGKALGMTLGFVHREQVNVNTGKNDRLETLHRISEFALKADVGMDFYNEFKAFFGNSEASLEFALLFTQPFQAYFATTAAYGYTEAEVAEIVGCLGGRLNLPLPDYFAYRKKNVVDERLAQDLRDRIEVFQTTWDSYWAQHGDPSWDLGSRPSRIAASRLRKMVPRYAGAFGQQTPDLFVRFMTEIETKCMDLPRDARLYERLYSCLFRIEDWLLFEADPNGPCENESRDPKYGSGGIPQKNEYRYRDILKWWNWKGEQTAGNGGLPVDPDIKTYRRSQCWAMRGCMVIQFEAQMQVGGSRIYCLSTADPEAPDAATRAADEPRPRQGAGEAASERLAPTPQPDRIDTINDILKSTRPGG